MKKGSPEEVGAMSNLDEIPDGIVVFQFFKQPSSSEVDSAATETLTETEDRTDKSANIVEELLVVSKRNTARLPEELSSVKEKQRKQQNVLNMLAVVNNQFNKTFENS